jgi:hypothetical protein
MTLQELQTLMSVMQSIFASLTLVIAGIWALYVFKALGQVARGKAERQKIETDIALGNAGLLKMETDREKTRVDTLKTQAEIQKIELDVKRQAIIDITIEASPQSLANDSSQYVSVVIEITNKGNRITRLSFEGKNPFSVTPVLTNTVGEELPFDMKRRVTLPVPRASYPANASPSLVIRPGGREQIPFFFRVNSPGLYFLSFSSQLSTMEQNEALEAGAKYATSWVAKKYLIVE